MLARKFYLLWNNSVLASEQNAMLKDDSCLLFANILCSLRDAMLRRHLGQAMARRRELTIPLLLALSLLFQLQFNAIVINNNSSLFTCCEYTRRLICNYLLGFLLD